MMRLSGNLVALRGDPSVAGPNWNKNSSGAGCDDACENEKAGGLSLRIFSAGSPRNASFKIRQMQRTWNGSRYETSLRD